MISTKKSIFASAVALLLCFAMLLGTTFAWFTDSVTSANNIIQSGTLDVEMYWAEGTEDPSNTSWNDASKGAIFNNDKWEPGYVEVRHIKIENKGTLALQYKITIVANGEVTDLSDVIDVYYLDPAAQIATRDQLNANNKLGTLTEVLANLAGTGTGSLAKGEADTVTLALKMQETAGNEYQEKALCDGGFSVQLLATQATGEFDSFGGDYDAGAQWPDMNFGQSVTVPVGELDADNKTIAPTTMSGYGYDVTIPAGVKVADGADKFTLTVDTTERSSNINMNMGQVSRSLDVHIDGISLDNDVPVIIDLGAVLPINYKEANIALYHVEDGVANKMNLVDAPALHNDFSYDPTTGEVSIALASFSEVTAVINEGNPWTGGFDYSWYNEVDTVFEITTAEQLAAFSAIVGGMNKVTGRNSDGTYTYSGEVIQDSFKGKTVKLGANIKIGDVNTNDVDASENGIVFYPIGYYNSEGTYEKTGTAITSGFRNFEGTFDGQGNTISDWYQNTWEMKGDHNWYDATLQYYRDGMGLFGKVYGGTVKNLVVRNFSSDGEITTTGTIAAYADGAHFENIQIYDCNPRVYNIGNGGIVGVVGWYAKEANLKTTFNNITVDNSNKISALWGSYDVSCGGIVGQYYSESGQTSAGKPTNGGLEFTNCTIGAVLDVYNDVCGNYQYYQYRYAGMIVGTLGENTTPAHDHVKFNNVTVYIGNWADYYYCEFEKNSGASYTEDFQFSRVEKNDINFDPNTNMPDFANKPCHHEHTENEDKMGLYLPFDQLYTGYGWGSSPVREATGVTVIRYFYTITYMDAIGEKVLAVEYATEGERSESKLWADKYTVRTESITPAGSNQVFKYWVNAGSAQMTEIPAGNRNDIILYESWDNPYTARFLDQFGNVIYSETFTKSNPTVSVPPVPNVDDCIGVWEDYNLKNATGDVTIRPIYTYAGKLKLTPVDDPKDGVIDYYKVEAVAELDETTIIPGYFNGLPVKVVEKLYKNEDNFDYGSGVTTIIIQEGVEELKGNSLAYTKDLDVVKLPSTITTLGKNTFSRNFGDDKKVLQIIYNGTGDDFKKVMNNSVESTGFLSADLWYGGLKVGSTVECTDGTYTLTKAGGISSKGTWTWTANT